GVEGPFGERWAGASARPWGERQWLGTDSDLTRHPDGCYVAVVDGEVAGFITTVMSRVKRQGHIHDLAVDARLRGRGIGRQLINHALDVFRKGGMKIARIETLTQNEVGAHLYPALGFQVIASQYHYAMPLNDK